MRIVFLQSYPIYHDLLSTSRWLSLENRDKWMPGILSNEGFKTELWATADQNLKTTYHHDQLGSYPIRLFEVTRRHRNTKFDYSEHLVDYALTNPPDLIFIKGVDGGSGTQLLENFILSKHIPFIFIVGGKFYNRYVPKADAIGYETSYQRNQLMKPGPWSVHKKIPAEKLFHIPKSVDTRHFRPNPEIAKEVDVISLGRLISKYKNYDELGKLSTELKTVLIGDGPERDHLQRKFPHLIMPGYLAHEDLPDYLNKARLFFHSGMRDFYPRVLSEAMACGLPCVAFEEIITPDVLPLSCGLRVSTHNYVNPIKNLLQHPKKLHNYSRNARQYVVENQGISSSRNVMLAMLEMLHSKRIIDLPEAINIT